MFHWIESKSLELIQCTETGAYFIRGKKNEKWAIKLFEPPYYDDSECFPEQRGIVISEGTYTEIQTKWNQLKEKLCVFSLESD